MKPLRICLLPKLSGVGGMVSFQAKLSAGLFKRGIEACYSLNDHPYNAILVIGGSKEVVSLWRAKSAGIPIIQRLDGMNWLHRVRRTGIKHNLRAIYGNRLLAFIRSHLADGIIYQSRFAREWWERVYGVTKKPNQVIYNGVDLDRYNPSGECDLPGDRIRLLLVEGNFGGGYEIGLDTANQLGTRLASKFPADYEMWVVGRVAEELKEKYKNNFSIPIIFKGLVPSEDIPAIDRSAHVLYAADLNAACPNSVIEALACGLPVVGFDTGALPEIVQLDAGKLAPYGGNPWRLEAADMDGLAQVSHAVIEQQERYRKGARVQAEASFGLDKMVETYLDVFKSISKPG